MRVEVLRRRWAGDDLGWESDPEATSERVDLTTSEVSFPADGRERRLLVTESEGFVHAGGGGG